MCTSELEDLRDEFLELMDERDALLIRFSEIDSRTDEIINILQDYDDFFDL